MKKVKIFEALECFSAEELKEITVDSLREFAGQLALKLTVAEAEEMILEINELIKIDYYINID